MRSSYVFILTITSGVFVLLLAVFVYSLYVVPNRQPYACRPIPAYDAEMGNHGYRLWSDANFKSFEHRGDPICVPSGWMAVGESERTASWVRFPEGQAGILVALDKYTSELTQFANTPFAVNIVQQKNNDPQSRDAYLALIDNAFRSIGALFQGIPIRDRSPMTVLITAGIAGDTLDATARVYPDPGPKQSSYITLPDYYRGEELFIHAIMHLFNRYRTVGESQGEIPDGDWQELEASWAEIAFASRNESRHERAAYLYEVHETVFSGNPIQAFSHFADMDDSEDIHPGIIVPEGASYYDYQYNHYILGPLVLLGVEGLLSRTSVLTAEEAPSVASLIGSVRSGRYPDFLTALQVHLTDGDIEQVRGWMFKGDGIPKDLIEDAVALYDR